ncbi:MAG: TGS domain-containing protein, partial [Candidatus Odinarchaeia archaeon]
KIGDYPFTTKEPEVGMMNFEGVLIQIVEAPALFENATNSSSGPAVFSVIRNADAIVIVVDLLHDPLNQLKIIYNELDKNGIKINSSPPNVKIKKTGSGGLQFFGLHYLVGEKDDLIEILKEAGISNATIHFYSKTTLTEFAEALDERIVYRPAIIIANKGDAAGSSENFKILSNAITTAKIVPISIKKNVGLDFLKKSIFEILHLIRIYTKESDGTVSKKPLVIKEGSTVSEVAKRLHNKFIKKFKFAKIYGKSAKFPGEKVGLDHKLMDKDIVQIFIQ